MLFIKVVDFSPLAKGENTPFGGCKYPGIPVFLLADLEIRH